MLAAALAAAAASGLASIPHCAGMCGPLAACASGRAAWRYHVARSIAYGVLGAVAGTAGSELVGALDVRWGNALVSWTLALALGLGAYRLWRGREAGGTTVRLGVAPRRPSLADRAMNRAMRWAGDHPAGLGALTALLPCGALYSALLVAAAAGSGLAGGLAMLVFALVSGIGLALVSLLAARLRGGLGPGRAPARVLASVLLVGALLLAVRPVAALRAPDPASCHAPSGS